MEYTAEEYLKRIENKRLNNTPLYSRKEMTDFAEKYAKAITVTNCCKSEAELLHTEVFKLANKLAINGYGNEAVKMHQICNGM